MTTYYVGPGGNDALDGTTWDKRKETLNGAEDIPVVAGDTVYVGPGVYRETLTCDVSGSSGNPITYIGDVSGYYTDGVGGIVRITGSDDDIVENRRFGIYISGKSYRTFRGFSFDSMREGTLHDAAIRCAACDNIIVEDCAVMLCKGAGIYIDGLTGTDLHFEIRRCYFGSLHRQAFGIDGASGSTLDATSVVENCIMEAAYYGYTNGNDGPTGMVVKNCTVSHCKYAIFGSYPGRASAYNCIVTDSDVGMQDTTNDYLDVTNSNRWRFSGGSIEGANCVDYTPGFRPELLVNGLQLISPTPSKFELAEWSPIKYRTGSNPPPDDFYGKPRPTANAKNSWGAIQYKPGIKSTANPYGSETVHTRLPDAGLRQIFIPVVGGQEIEISVHVYRAANYAGTLPHMIIREIGQSERTTTDVGSAEQYNLLTDTFTPQTNTRYLAIDLVSDNTASSGDYFVDFGGFSAKRTS